MSKSGVWDGSFWTLCLNVTRGKVKSGLLPGVRACWGTRLESLEGLGRQGSDPLPGRGAPHPAVLPADRWGRRRGPGCVPRASPELSVRSGTSGPIAFPTRTARAAEPLLRSLGTRLSRSKARAGRASGLVAPSGRVFDVAAPAGWQEGMRFLMKRI